MREISEGEEPGVKVNGGADPRQSGAEAGASSAGAGTGGREAWRGPEGGGLRAGGPRGEAELMSRELGAALCGGGGGRWLHLRLRTLC